MKGNALSEKLWSEYIHFEFTYPDNKILPIRKKIGGTAFFPGGEGLWEKSDVEIDVLVLGQDFGTKAYYDKILADETVKDTDCPTWINMLALFNKVGIKPERCFFSNVFMGLRTEDNMTGSLIRKSSEYDKYRMQSADFLIKQIQIINPKVIIVLGNEPTKMLMNVLPLKDWYSMNKVSDITTIAKAEYSEAEYLCVALCHPSMRNSNKRFRKYKEWNNGNCPDVEVKMLEDLMVMINSGGDFMLKPVRHHNLIGREINESLDLYPEKSEDREIYCRMLHAIVEPQIKDCENCPFLSGLEQGNGIECTWPDECEEDHVVFHEDRFKEYERVDKMIERCKDMDYPLPGVDVYFAMSEEQAKKLNKPVCIQPNLPKSKDVYFAMRKIPSELCEEKVIGYECIIKLKKQNVYKVMEYLYPDGYDFDINKYLGQIEGPYIWIIGFGD